MRLDERKLLPFSLNAEFLLLSRLGALSMAPCQTAAVVCPIMTLEKRLNHSVDLHFANPPFDGNHHPPREIASLSSFRLD
ncbi:hypothetical protein ACFYE8_28670 [Rhizobium leguminosarum]|uniref:hypothetical protein n=1 Tax=Rhizobium leguminosarum TaxID=384 RepID=UPI0036D7F9EE